MNEIEFPLQTKDQFPAVMRIMYRSNWFNSAWVRNLFELYYVLLDLNQIDLVLNKRHTNRIKQTLGDRNILYDKSIKVVENMNLYQTESDNRYRDWHQISVVPKGAGRIEWEQKNQKYVINANEILKMTPETYDIDRIVKHDLRLADLIALGSLVSAGSEMYETLSLLDSVKDGMLQQAYFRRLRTL